MKMLIIIFLAYVCLSSVTGEETPNIPISNLILKVQGNTITGKNSLLEFAISSDFPPDSIFTLIMSTQTKPDEVILSNLNVELSKEDISINSFKNKFVFLYPGRYYVYLRNTDGTFLQKPPASIRLLENEDPVSSLNIVVEGPSVDVIKHASTTSPKVGTIPFIFNVEGNTLKKGDIIYFSTTKTGIVKTTDPKITLANDFSESTLSENVVIFSVGDYNVYYMDSTKGITQQIAPIVKILAENQEVDPNKSLLITISPSTIKLNVDTFIFFTITTATHLEKTDAIQLSIDSTVTATTPTKLDCSGMNTSTTIICTFNTSINGTYKVFLNQKVQNNLIIEAGSTVLRLTIAFALGALLFLIN